jgi:hypothetical protein
VKHCIRSGAWLALAAPLLVAVTSCTSTPSLDPVVQSTDPGRTATPPRGLDADGVAAWTRWQTQDLSDYRYQLTVGCFCPAIRTTVEVRDGDVTLIDGKPYRGKDVIGFDDSAPTIDALFVQLAQAMRRADDVDAKYDPEAGVPTSIDVDWMTNAIDDEIGYSVTDLGPLPPSTNGTTN